MTSWNLADELQMYLTHFWWKSRLRTIKASSSSRVSYSAPLTRIRIALVIPGIACGWSWWKWHDVEAVRLVACLIQADTAEATLQSPLFSIVRIDEVEAGWMWALWYLRLLPGRQTVPAPRMPKPPDVMVCANILHYPVASPRNSSSCLKKSNLSTCLQIYGPLECIACVCLTINVS